MANFERTETSWAEEFIGHVARRRTLRVMEALNGLRDAGVDPEAVEFIGHGWDDTVFGWLEAGVTNERVQAINKAWARYASSGKR